MHLQVDTSSPVPPYEQIRAQIQAMVVGGALPAGTRLPPIRQLAGDLALATNTVARAYRELEADGVITTHGRRGTFVRSAVLDKFGGDTGSAGIASAAATEYVHTLRRLGFNAQEAARLVEITWNQG